MLLYACTQNFSAKYRRRQRKILATISYLSIFDLLFTIFTFYIRAHLCVAVFLFFLSLIFFLFSVFGLLFVAWLFFSLCIWYGIVGTVCVFRLILMFWCCLLHCDDLFFLFFVLFPFILLIFVFIHEKNRFHSLCVAICVERASSARYFAKHTRAAHIEPQPPQMHQWHHKN